MSEKAKSCCMKNSLPALSFLGRSHVGSWQVHIKL